MGSRAGLDEVENRKFLILPGLKFPPLIVEPVASRYTDCAIPDTRELNVKISRIYDNLTYLLRGFSPQANYTVRATVACRRS
jgi:hypothetical protein